MLSKVGCLYIVSYGDISIVAKLAQDATHERCLSLAIASYEGNLLAAVDSKIDIAEHFVIAETLCNILAHHRIVSAASGGREFQSQTTRVLLVDDDGYHLFELLDAALHLHSLCRLVAETLDKLFRIGNLFLLVLVGTNLLLATLLAQLHKFVVRHLVIVNASAGNLYRAGGDGVQKRAVVADKHHCIAAARKELLEPLYTFNIKVVGGLVEQKDIGVTQQQFGKLYSHAPATAELARGARKVAAFEAQSLQGTLNFGLVVATAHHSILLVKMGVFLYKLMVAFALVVGARGKLVVHAVQTLLHFVNVLESLLGLLKNRASVCVSHHLRQITNSNVSRQRHIAAAGRLLAR